jgi:hypothetical protein
MATLEKKQNTHRMQAEEYLRKHHIIELFEDLCTAVAYKKPDLLEEFLVEQLELRKKKGKLELKRYPCACVQPRRSREHLQFV